MDVEDDVLLLLFDLLLFLLLELPLSFEFVLLLGLSLADTFNISALKLLDELLELSDAWPPPLLIFVGDDARELDCFKKLGDDDDDIDEVLVLLLVVDFFFEPFCEDCFGSTKLVEAILLEA